MNLKKKLAMSIATGALAVSMIGGGTYAYFNDVEVSTNQFKAGTLNLAMNPSTLINLDKLKPGDWMPRYFELENKGNLDINQVLLSTEYTQGGGGDVDFGKHIRVNFLTNVDKAGISGPIWNPKVKPSNPIVSKTLYELKTMTPDAVANLSNTIFTFEDSGLKAGNTDHLFVVFEFVDDATDQNALQGAYIDLKWSFKATQHEGSMK
ncbi:CalY family protein [Saccharococcus sp. Marseille-Q5394]|uniref:CalY family protein n=1 Tax=Saccharococcus sp. Marseille-Q5394 TaxID=2972778 RepID=UPI0021C736EE|nr:CalY family protein [Saccharococcus sp. Marseille-Q5394]